MDGGVDGRLGDRSEVRPEEAGDEAEDEAEAGEHGGFGGGRGTDAASVHDRPAGGKGWGRRALRGLSGERSGECGPGGARWTGWQGALGLVLVLDPGWGRWDDVVGWRGCGSAGFQGPVGRAGVAARKRPVSKAPPLASSVRRGSSAGSEQGSGDAAMTGMCPLWRADVSSFLPDVSSFRPDVSTFWPKVSTLAGQVSH